MDVTVSTNDLLSVAEAAKILKRPRITLYRWIEKGQLVAVKLGGTLYIPRSEVERLSGKG